MLSLSLIALGLFAVALYASAGDRQNYSGDLSIAAPSGGTVRGLGYSIGGRIMVARETQAQTVACLFAVSGGVTATKVAATGKSFAIGDKVYYVSASKSFTPSATGNTLVGTAIAAAAATDTTVDFVIEGLPPTAT